MSPALGVVGALLHARGELVDHRRDLLQAARARSLPAGVLGGRGRVPRHAAAGRSSAGEPVRQ